MSVENLAGVLFDDLPDQCPGCGLPDTPLGDGPSSLMLLWQTRLGTYLCLTCNMNYCNWETGRWIDDEAKALNKPRCLKNVEAIARDAEPHYESSVNDNPMSIGRTHRRGS